MSSGPVLYLGDKPITKNERSPSAAGTTSSTTGGGGGGGGGGESAVTGNTTAAAVVVPTGQPPSPSTGRGSGGGGGGGTVDPLFVPARYVALVDGAVANYQRAVSWRLTHDENVNTKLSPLIDMFILDLVSAPPTQLQHLLPPPPPPPLPSPAAPAAAAPPVSSFSLSSFLNRGGSSADTKTPPSPSVTSTTPPSPNVSAAAASAGPAITIPISVAIGSGITASTTHTSIDSDVKSYVTDRSKYVCLVYRRDLKYMYTHDQNAERVLRPILLDEVKRVLKRWHQYMSMIAAVEQQQMKLRSAAGAEGVPGAAGRGKGSAAQIEGQSSAPEVVAAPALYELEAKLVRLRHVFLRFAEY